MIFHFTAEWELTPSGIDWLTRAYFPDKLADAIRQIREARAIDGHAFDPNRTSRFANGVVEVNVLLKTDNWVADGRGLAGVFMDTGASGSAAVPEIWINWSREMDSTNNLYGRIVRHELTHMLLWMQYPPVDNDLQRYSDDYLNSQHGRAAPTKDIFLLALNRKIADYYPSNHSSNPGTLPCGS